MTRKFKRIDAPHYTPVPDYFFDEVLSHLKSAAQIQIYLFICRQTFGWKKSAENLSLNYIANGLGLKRNTVVKATKALVEMELILRQTNANEERGNLRSTYSLNMTDSPIKLRPVQEGEATLGDLNHLGGRGLESPSPRGLQSPKSYTHINKDNNNVVVVSDSQNGNDLDSEPTLEDSQLVKAAAAFLESHGIGPRVSQRLARQFELDELKTKADYLAFLQESDSVAIKKPAAWLRRAIEEDYTAPDGYLSPDERKAKAESQAAKEKALAAKEQAFQARIARERQEQQERLNQAAELLKSIQSERGIGEEELKLWEMAKEIMLNGTWGASQLAAAELLEIDRENNQVVIGVTNEVALTRLSHPSRTVGISNSMGFVLGASDVAVEFELLTLSTN